MAIEQTVQPEPSISSRRTGVENRTGKFGQDPFQLLDLYPDAAGILAHVHAPIADVVSDGLVALDASVLLYAYEFKSESLTAIGELYSRLADAERLVIPSHAVREFYKNRTKTLARVYDRITVLVEKPVQNPFTEKLGLLEENKEYKSAKEIAGQIAHLGKQLVDKLRVLQENLESSVGNDPVSLLYRKVFERSIVELDVSGDARSALLSEWEERRKRDIGPGLEDGDKGGNAIGDLLFWKTVLGEASRKGGHCIVVIEEKKLDWWGGSKSNPFQPRPELVEEYRVASRGGSLFLMSLATTLKNFDKYERAKDGAADKATATEPRKVSLAKVARNIEVHDQQRYKRGETPQERQSRLLAEAELLRYQSMIESMQADLNEAANNEEFLRVANRVQQVMQSQRKTQQMLDTLNAQRRSAEANDADY